MSLPSEILRDEHDAIRGLLVALERIAERIRVANELPKEDLYDAVAVLADFADRCHQGKEEKILFPVLAKASPHAAVLVDRLSKEHEAFRQHVQVIRQLLPRSRTKAVRKRIAGHLSTYVRLHREHMRIVDEQVLPEVERRLALEERRRLSKEFAHFEQTEIGRGMQNAYRAIIRRLVETYADWAPGRRDSRAVR